MSAGPWNRRTFLKSAGASAAAVAVFGVGGGPPAHAATSDFARLPSWTRYRIDSGADVRVHVSGGRRFVVAVTDHDGNVLEQHRNLTVGRLFRLESRHFTVSALPEGAAA